METATNKKPANNNMMKRKIVVSSFSFIFFSRLKKGNFKNNMFLEINGALLVRPMHEFVFLAFPYFLM